MTDRPHRRDRGREDLETRDDAGRPDAGRSAALAPDAPVPAPGEPPGTMAPEVHAVGADENEGKVGRVRDVAHAPPGKPDGEVDTRP